MRTKTERIVIDTNVIIAAARSNRGASFKMLSLIDDGKIRPVLSVPLFYEYQDVLARLTSDVENNKKHFRGVEKFGINVKTPFELLTDIGEL